MKNKHIAMMKNLIAATKYATQETTKVEKRKQKQVSEKVTDALEFFMVKTDSETNSQRLYDMCCAIRPILSAIGDELANILINAKLRQKETT